MYLEESFRYLNDYNIKMMVILATIILILALVQLLKPKFSLTYHLNSNPAYLKVKTISRLITAATLYCCALYFYFFSEETWTSWYTFWALWTPILGNVYKWGLAKLFNSKKTNE